MSQFYNDMANTVDELLSEFGMPVSLTIFGPSTRDLTTGKEVATVTVLAGLRGISMGYDTIEVNGTSILATDRKIIISPVGVTAIPKQGDKIIFNDPLSGNPVTYKVETTKVIAPGGTIITIEVQARA